MSSWGQDWDGVGLPPADSLPGSWSWNSHLQWPSYNWQTTKRQARGPQTAKSGLPPIFAKHRFIETQPHSLTWMFSAASFMPQLCAHAKSLRVSSSSRPRGLQPARLLCPWDSPGKSTGVGCHSLLQPIFLTQGSNQRLLWLLHWQTDYLSLVPSGKLIVKETHWGLYWKNFLTPAVTGSRPQEKNNLNPCNFFSHL